MTITGITASFASFSSLRLSVSASQPAAPSASTAPVQTADSVTLSPAAAAAEAPPATTDAPPASGAAPTAPSASTTADRATALFAALDADQDGSITEDEFKTGAKQLLAKGGDARRASHEHHDHGDHEGRGAGRLDRRLERLFDRVDANGDGSVDQTELTAALTAAEKRRQPPPPQDPGQPANTPSGQGAGGGTVVTFSMTVVSIAVKRYTALQDGAPTTAASPGGTAATPSTATPDQSVDAARAA